jgi:hypothetical protein
MKPADIDIEVRLFGGRSLDLQKKTKCERVKTFWRKRKESYAAWKQNFLKKLKRRLLKNVQKRNGLFSFFTGQDMKNRLF